MALSISPIQISILILDEATMMTVASVLDPLRAANRLAVNPIFSWQIFSSIKGSVRLTGEFQISTDGAFSSTKGGDYLIVVASFNQEIHGDTNLIQDLRKLAGKFKIICGVEAGTWLLARAGIISTHKVTTHWEDFESMAEHYPDLEIIQDRYTIDENIWTSGGASPALDMMLHLIENEAGRPLALEVASVFIYDQVHDPSDSQPNISLGKLKFDEPRVAAAVRLMEKTIDAPLLIPVIAKRTKASVKTLEILFKRHLDQTPARYYLNLRLNAARKLIIDTKLSIQEISLRTGFDSQSSFTRSFRVKFNTNPTALRLDRR